MFQTQDENGFQKSFFVSELQELEVRAKFGQTDQNGQIQLKFQALVASRRNPGHGFGRFKKRAKRMIWKLRVLHKLIMYDSNTLTDVLGNIVRRGVG